MDQSGSYFTHIVFVHDRVCIDIELSLKVKAMALCKIRVWTILSSFGPIWLILFPHRFVRKGTCEWILNQVLGSISGSLNVSVYTQVSYFLFHMPNLTHKELCCMKCSCTKFQGQRLWSNKVLQNCFHSNVLYLV